MRDEMRSIPPERSLFADTVPGRERLVTLLRAAFDNTSREDSPVPPLRALEDDPLGTHRDALPANGVGEHEAIQSLTYDYLDRSVNLTHPATAGRLQCPPLTAAVAAETVAAMSNQSVHVRETGPAAVDWEQRLVADIASLLGYPLSAGGTLTAGGTISTMTALLLARDEMLLRHYGMDASTAGITGSAVRPRVLCSDFAHFSIARTAGFIGLGRDSITRVPTDRDGRMIPSALLEVLNCLGDDEIPVAVVATAGTTDTGAFDPISEIATVTEQFGTWLHVDAAYGGPVLFSKTHAQYMAGAERADSVSLDFHKLGWVPTSASMLLFRDSDTASPLWQRAPYANPTDDEAAGYAGLLGSNMQTTRRADSLKILTVLRALGTSGMGSMVDRCHELAAYAADRIDTHTGLELVRDPNLCTVLLRCTRASRRGPGEREDSRQDQLNAEVRRILLDRGTVVITRAQLPACGNEPSQLCLKLTFLNPLTRRADIDKLLEEVWSAALEATNHLLDNELSSFETTECSPPSSVRWDPRSTTSAQ